MTITVTNIVAGPFTATGAEQEVAFDFKVFTREEVEVVYGSDRTAIDPYTYVVEPNRTIDGQVLEGGTITLLAGALPAGTMFNAVAKPAKTQELVFSDTGSRLRNLNEVADRAALRAIRAQYDGALEGAGAELIEVATEAGRAAAADKLDKDADNADASTFSLNAPFLPATGPGDIPYSMRTRLQERRSAMEFIPRVLHAGIRANTNVIPVDVFLNDALASGLKYIDLPEGTFAISETAWLKMELDGQQLRGSGDGTIIKRVNSSGVPAYPMLVAKGEGNILVDIAFKCEAQASLPPAINNIAFASGVIIMGDGSYAEGLSIHDAWDNGLSFGRFDTTTGVFNPGEPAGGEAVAIYTYNCGCGIRPDAPGFPRHQAGGGVNNLNGQGIRFRDCVDWFSRTGWINDYASGATATFNNMISYYPQKSRVAGDGAGFPTEYSRFGGFGCYVAGRAQMQNCEIYDAEADGVWVDGFAHNCNISGVRVKGAKQRAFRIQGRDHLIKNLISEDCSYGNTDVYPAVLVEGTSDGADGTLNSRNIMIDGVITTGPYHTYGLQVLAGGGGLDRKVQGFAANMQLNGTRGQVDNPNYASFALRGYTSSVPTAGVYTLANSITQWDGTQVFTGEGTNAVTSPWGDAAGRGQVWIRERRDQNKRLVLGFDGDRNVGVVQVTHAGVAPRALDLNPNPAEVRTYNRNEAGQFGETINAAFEVRMAGSEKRILFGYDGPNNRGVIQAAEKAVAARKLSINPYSGDVEIGDGTVGAVFVSVPGLGLRKLELTAADGAVPAGARTFYAV